MLRDLGYDDRGIHKLYREMRATVKHFRQDEADAVAAQLDDQDAKLPRWSAQRVNPFAFRLKAEATKEDLTPEGSRQRYCWCDGPRA